MVEAAAGIQRGREPERPPACARFGASAGRNAACTARHTAMREATESWIVGARTWPRRGHRKSPMTATRPIATRSFKARRVAAGSAQHAGSRANIGEPWEMKRDGSRAWELLARSRTGLSSRTHGQTVVRLRSARGRGYAVLPTTHPGSGCPDHGGEDQEAAANGQVFPEADRSSGRRGRMEDRGEADRKQRDRDRHPTPEGLHRMAEAAAQFERDHSG